MNGPSSAPASDGAPFLASPLPGADGPEELVAPPSTDAGAAEGRVAPALPGATAADDFVTPPLRARHVYLKPVTPSDYPFLQMLELAGELAPRWRHRGATPNPDQWAQTLWTGVLAQFMVVGVTTNKPIGRVVIYQPNFQDRYAYFAALRFEPNDRSPIMMLGISLFLRYVFTYWDFDKLYMEVPEYNLPQFASGLGRFFEIEGRLRGHFRVGGRSWDQLILALYRETAVKEGARLRLDRGQRSVITPETTVDGSVPSATSIVPDPSAASPVPDPNANTVTWEEFLAEVASIADVDAADVHPDTRVLEDLALDSLALAELGVVLVDRYDTWSLSRELETRSWENVTVRDLYDEYLTGAPPSTPGTARSSTPTR
jgi:acyl carrier protein/RimJ/RimL family protein N-acetyltransferase